VAIVRRRDFITLIGGAAVWPVAARAQEGERVRRIGVLISVSEFDQQTQPNLAAFREGLARFGWLEGRNLRMDIRFVGSDPQRVRAYAAELVNLAPDLIVTSSGATVRESQHLTQTIPIVITGGGDPGISGFVTNIAHPEGNTTGITNLYASIGGKWVELLKQAYPKLERVGLLDNPKLNPNSGSVYVTSILESARALAVTIVRLQYQDSVDIVRGIDGFCTEPNGGLIVLPPPPTLADRAAIHRLAAQHRLPTVYHATQYAVEGGLLAYGSSEPDRWQRASSFVDRILRGAKVADLPLEFPTKFELAINLKTAKTIGIDVPLALLARADEVIE
jgi:putative ABC transport system substrate-binding protein